ncbi:prolactin-8A9-like, partial [Grammomys surdaster]|uniref:prolactin-8A9-like n=1 Tax=Grammomys surdaster TaxID=491861 RepID=UPI0010A002D7
MELPLSQPYFSGALLLLVVSNVLLWDKAASIPACQAKEGGCWDPLVETFNSAIQKAETLQKLASQFYIELYHNQFSSGQFADFNSQLIRRDKTVVRAGTYCHSTLTNPPNRGTEHADIEVSFLQGLSPEFQKQYIGFV